jgi:FkbM family methyltransferase
LDVGANIGDYSWRIVNASAETAIEMFEPDATNARLLSQTMAKNNLNRITLHPVAVSDRSGSLEFLIDSISGATGSIVDHSANTWSLHSTYGLLASRIVPCIDLDSLAEKLRGQRVLIKIDVEGAEEKVLRGAQGILREVRPVLLVECFDLQKIAWLSELKYLVRDLRENANYLAYPEEMKAKIEEEWLR